MLPKRIEAKIERTESCWLWTAACSSGGYGVVWWEGRMELAHRLVYMLLVGPIPEGLQLDHVREQGCKHRNCVNPAHLEPVTPHVNTHRGDTPAAANAQKTHCPKGHSYAEHGAVRPGTNKRRCYECERERSREYQRRKARGR